MRQAYLLPFVIAGAFGIGVAVPRQATAQVTDRIIDIYGDDRCPASQGQEIVVCRKHPESERFRIPKELRDVAPQPQAAGGNNGAVSAVNSTGGSGVQINSCNAIGAGVNTGCVKNELDAWKAQRRADKQAETNIP